MESSSPASKALAFVRKNRQTVGIALLAVGLIMVGMLLRVPETDGPDSPRDRKGVDDFLRGLHVIGSTVEPAEEPVSEPAPAPVATPPKATGLTYESAVELYAGRRFQFVKCRGNPGNMVVTKGTKIMLDNRDTSAHTIAVGKASYRVAGLGFAIATVNTVGLQNITCDGGGSASITVTP